MLQNSQDPLKRTHKFCQ